MSSNPTKIPHHSRILTDERYKNLAYLLQGLNQSWTPHEGQQAIGEYIFLKGARRVFIECGRKWGKTDFAVDLLWRLANMIQGGQIYYFAARAKAVRELLWAPQRLQGHGPKEYIKDIHKTDMRVTFTSETFVKLDGADEFAQTKGFNPDVVVLDEFADYGEDFWVAMSPNFASKDAIVIIISSPPWLLESEPGTPVIFVRIADMWKKYMEQAHKLGKPSKYIYVNAPTHQNPHIGKEWLAQEEKDLREMGLEDVYEREYLAKRVVGGGKRIIGTFLREKHVVSHEWLIKEKIEKNYNQLTWVHGCDPGNSSVFGALFAAINPYTKEIFFLDEHYCKNEDETTEHILRPLFEEKEDELYPSDLNPDPERWGRVYDEEAKWWQVGVLNEFGITYHPTEKAVNSREFGLSIWRSLFRYDKGFVSDRCKWLAWELENWRKDGKGRIPKMNDHLIDTGRYIFHYADYFLLPEDREVATTPHPRIQIQAMHRRTIDRDLAEMGEELYGNDPHEFTVKDNLGMGEEWSLH